VKSAEVKLTVNALVSSEAVLPIARPPATVHNGDDLYAEGRLPKDYYEWKTPQHHSPRAKNRIKDMARISGDLIHCGIKFVQKTLSGPPASLYVPVGGRAGFFERSRMDPQGLDAQPASRSRRR
jgi:hypothetical protein